MDRQNPLRILLVEDSMEDALIFGHSLAKIDLAASFQPVANGHHAIVYLTGEPPYDDREKYPLPSVIITDLAMPDSDGFELLEWLKKRPAFAMIPTVVLSASNSEEDKQKAAALGANLFLTKPRDLLSLQELLRAIYKFLKRSDTADRRGNRSSVNYRADRQEENAEAEDNQPSAEESDEPQEELDAEQHPADQTEETSRHEIAPERRSGR